MRPILALLQALGLLCSLTKLARAFSVSTHSRRVTTSLSSPLHYQLGEATTLSKLTDVFKLTGVIMRLETQRDQQADRIQRLCRRNRALTKTIEELKLQEYRHQHQSGDVMEAPELSLIRNATEAKMLRKEVNHLNNRVEILQSRLSAEMNKTRIDDSYSVRVAYWKERFETEQAARRHESQVHQGLLQETESHYRVQVRDLNQTLNSIRYKNVKDMHLAQRELEMSLYEARLQIAQLQGRVDESKMALETERSMGLLGRVMAAIRPAKVEEESIGGEHC